MSTNIPKKVLTEKERGAFLHAMPEELPAPPEEKMTRVYAGTRSTKRLYKLRPALGFPAKAPLVTAAVRFAAEMAEAKRVRLENGIFVEAKK